MPKTSSTKTTRTTPVRLPPNPFQSEILEAVSKARTRNKNVVSAIPDGSVPYKPNEAPKGTEHTSLRSEQKRFYNFVVGGNDKLSKTRRETIFIQILEGLHPEEAYLLILVKDKQLTSRYNINRSQVEEAFPDIQWGNRSRRTTAQP